MDAVFRAYEEYVDRTHLPFNTRSTWDTFCAPHNLAGTDPVWDRYCAQGLALVRTDGAVEPVAPT